MAKRAPTPATKRPRPRIALGVCAAVGLFLSLGLILRASSLTRFDVQFDEQISRAVVENVWHGDLTNNWANAKIPFPEFRINCYNFSSYIYADSAFVGLIRSIAGWISKPLEYTVLWDRLFSVLLGTGAIYIFYLIALRLYDQNVALASLVFMAAIPLLVQDAHYGRPEAFVTLVTGMAYLALVNIMTEAAYIRYLVAASVCFGILIACKISMVPISVLPFVCLWIKECLTARTALICIAGTIVGFFVGVPDAFFHPGAFWDGVMFLQTHYAGIHAPHGLVDGSITLKLLLQYFWQSTGPPFCLITILGMLLMLRQRRYTHFVILAAPVFFYLGYFSLQHTFFERNLSHVIPLMAICCGVGSVELAKLVPYPRLRSSMLVVITLVVLATPVWISGKLVFVAMPTSSEVRAKAYEQALVARLNVPVGVHTHLLTNEVVDGFVKRAGDTSEPILLRVVDYQDSFTKRHLADLTSRAGAREVGYFPSIFPKFSVSTLITYHSPALRYVLLNPSPQYVINGFVFVPWDRAGEPIRPDHIEVGTWSENASFPAVGLPHVHDRFFGSFTSAGDANQGTIHLGPFFVGGINEIGIPVVTGPVAAGLSISVADHATGDVIGYMGPPPVSTSWAVWQVVLEHSHPSQIDIVARDDGKDWGEWLAIGLPLRLNGQMAVHR